jgi:predicted 2-oxoglutarate/Fe(II)-dependent dioxygenase YbiX
MALQVNGFFPGELTPDVTVAGCIDIFENAWPNPLATIDMAERECANAESGAFWQKAGTFGQGPFQNARTNKILEVSQLASVSNNPALQNIHNQFNMLLLAASIPYAQRYGIQEGLWHEGYGLLKYNSGQEYKKHYDGGTEVGRAISAVCYLNNDYVGGEIEFPHFNVKIKPEPGMLILFPSNFAYSHIALPVTEGTKYAMVTWIRDRAI